MSNNSTVLHPHAKLNVPETWGNVKEFADWWINSGMPIYFNGIPEVYISDDATSVHLFRKNRFQVELYLVHPKPLINVHEHPDVEVIKMRALGRQLVLSDILINGKSHGTGIREESEKNGFPLFAFQHWLKRDPITIAAMWKGNTVGPLHESLIKRFNPHALVKNGYADTTLY